MSIEKPNNFNLLIEYFMFANTPAYLYKHIKSNSDLKSFLQLNEKDELIEFFNNTVTKTKMQIDEIVLLYVIICSASTILDVSEQSNFLNSLDFSYLEWGEYISNLVFYTSKSISVINLRPDITPTELSSSIFSSSSSSTEISKYFPKESLTEG